MNVKEETTVPEYLPYKDDPKYLIYNDGRVFSLKVNRFLSSSINGGHYLAVSLSINGKSSHRSIHKLVAEMFIINDDPINKDEVNHKDTDKLNNNYTNLEWITRSGNMIHAVENGKCKKGKKVLKCDINGNVLKEYDTIKDAAEKCGYALETLRKRLNGDNILRDRLTGIDYIWKYKDPSLKCKCPEGAVPIVGFENYFITMEGIIWSSLRQSLMVQHKTGGDYMAVYLTKNKVIKTRHVQVLVMETFVGNKPEGMIIHHINGNKDDNRLVNLKYMPLSEKSYCDIERGTRKRPIKRVEILCPYTHKVIKELPMSDAVTYLNSNYNNVYIAAKNGTMCAGYQIVNTGDKAKDLRIKISKVLQLDEDGVIVDTYDSVNEAGRINSFRINTIRDACKSGKLYKGFYWEYIYLLGFDFKSKVIPPPEGYIFELAEDEVSDEE